MSDKNKSKPMATIVASKCYETFGMQVIESNSFGVPVISSNVGNISKLVINGVTGVHFNSRDVNSLIEAVERFEGLNVKQMPKYAYESYKNMYSDNINYKLLLNIYNRLLCNYEKKQ